MTRMYFSSCRRCGRLWVVRYCERSLGMIPSNLPAPLVARRAASPGEGDMLVAGAPEQGVAGACG